MYLGRTKQLLQNRIRGHVFKKAMHRAIDISLVTKIEYAEFKTEADMNVYEIYYINKLKPPLNRDDLAHDELTISLPDAQWEVFTTPLWGKWKSKVEERTAMEKKQRAEKLRRNEERREMLRKLFKGEISKEEYEAFREGNE